MRVGKVTTRETADMVKESVFNMLGGTIHGTILDLFAGSGAYGLEAVSRGASYLYAVDNDKSAIKTMIENAKILNEAEKVSVILKDYQKYLDTLDDGLFFDVVFVDPPYDFIIYHEVMKQLEPHLSDLGYIVCESKKQVVLDEKMNSLIKVKERVYGIKRITIYQKK
ncbi:MAG: 16S rRNA (guanine(966)-N(2))-methyltransferase RsmD [Bacillota bacterium]